MYTNVSEVYNSSCRDSLHYMSNKFYTYTVLIDTALDK